MACQGLVPWLIGLICNLQRKWSVENNAPIHIVCNFQTGPISLGVTLH